MCWKSVFPGKDTAHPPQPGVQGHLLAEQPDLALMSTKISFYTENPISFSDSRRFWLVQQEECVQKREKKTLACPKGEINLLHNASQSGVPLAQQPWLQNHAHGEDAGRKVNLTLSNTVPAPLPCPFGPVHRESKAQVSPQSSPALALGTAVRFGCYFLPLPQQQIPQPECSHT